MRQDAAAHSDSQPVEEQLAEARALYLDLMKRCLLNLIYRGTEEKLGPYDERARLEGRDWPAVAHTMVGLKRLDNIQHCVEEILSSNIPGDLIEAGVWRGGASIFMRAVLQVYGERARRVWCADSFAGLPAPHAVRYDADAGCLLHTFAELAVALEEVKANFAAYGLLDEQVRFLPGWFRDTLPRSQVEQLSLIRLDADLYESTIVALESLYPKLSRGGFVIVDDYGAGAACRSAVDDYRLAHGIGDEIVSVDWTGIYWRRAV